MTGAAFAIVIIEGWSMFAIRDYLVQERLRIEGAAVATARRSRASSDGLAL